MGITERYAMVVSVRGIKVVVWYIGEGIKVAGTYRKTIVYESNIGNSGQFRYRPIGL